MSDMSEIAINNSILKAITGSKCYGTATENSDTDYVGIFIAPKQFYLGLESVEEVDLSIMSKQDNNKNDKNAIDIKYYEFRKFIKLAKDNNPNILDVLFTPNECIEHISDMGSILLANRHLFPHAGLKQRFIGYGKSQLHKAHIKIENYDALNIALEWLNKQCETEENLHRTLAEFRYETVPGIEFFKSNASIGDLSFNLNSKLSKVVMQVSERISKAGNRTELYTKYGMDTKFLSHACRLLLEGKEYLTTGQCEFPLKDRNFLLDIRNGLHSSESIIKYANDLITELDEGNYNIVVPSKPRTSDIEHLLIALIEHYWEK